MSATLIAVIPFALLGIVALLGFVGCVFHTGGLPDPDPYDDLIKGSESATTKLMAFWPLTESAGPTAFDLSSNKFNGTYMSNLGMSNYDGINKSAQASGNVTFGQPGILLGDALNNQQDTSVFFDGGVVSVPFEAAINMDPPFTVEAWVQTGPLWDDPTQPALRGVVVSNSTTSNTGFGLFATQDNFWILSLGVTDGVTSTTVQVPSKPSGPATVALNVPVYVAATFDGQQCTIFASGADSAPTQIAQQNLDPGFKYAKLQDPNTPLFIGAGLPQNGTSPPPKFPVIGTVQCVAIYNSILSQVTMQEHFTTGTTSPNS